MLYNLWALALITLAGTIALVPDPVSAIAQEKRPPVTGVAEPDLASIDAMILAFMRENEVPGASVAIAKDGRLVYARGFGFGDKQLGLAVQPNMRFRIASISKPITAVAILRLIEMGLLRLDDNPFAVLKIALPADADPRLRKITVRHLLQHTAGWDRAQSFDPMFRPLIIAKALGVKAPAQPSDVIRYMLDQPLDFTPGTRYAYSNFGYCILGRIIEKTSGQKYDAFVRKEILTPLGMKHTELGKTLTRAKDEVKYSDIKQRIAPAVVGPNVGKDVPAPYGAWYLEAMDSHGGWISTASDLVRFGSAFDPIENCKILKPASIRAMLARPPGLAGSDKEGNPRASFYGLGWNVRPTEMKDKTTIWHMGALDGTATLLAKRADGFCWAVLFNSRLNPKGAYLGAKVDPFMHIAVDRVKVWPKRNLFVENGK